MNFREIACEETEPDYCLMAEEAVDELLQSSEETQTWVPINEQFMYDEGLWDSIKSGVKSGWNKLAGKGDQQEPAGQPKKQTTTKKTATKKAPAKKTPAKKAGTTKKASATKKPAAKKAPAKKTTNAKNPAQKKTQDDGKKKKGGKLGKKAIELGKKYVQKKIGGPQGVEQYVKKNQAGIDKKMQKAPQGVQGAWESIKTICAAGGKKTLEFCKKHWKAIVVVIVIIIAICLLIKFGMGSSAEQVVNSETAQSKIKEINAGAQELKTGTTFHPADDDDINIDDDSSSSSSSTTSQPSSNGKTYNKDYWGDEEKANGGNYYQHTDDGHGNTTTKWRVRTGNRELYNKAMNARDQINDYQAAERQRLQLMQMYLKKSQDGTMTDADWAAFQKLTS